jgi:7,8-dihydroneopterin aldolase/epimerase/oxygenase
MDIIFLDDFRVKTLIGVYPWERRVAQTIQLDLQIGLPSRRASETDHIDDAMDYARIVQAIHDILDRKHFSLLEALAEHIALMIMREFNSPWVKVSVAKLGIIRGIRKVGVSIERGSKS